MTQKENFGVPLQPALLKGSLGFQCNIVQSTSWVAELAARQANLEL